MPIPNYNDLEHELMCLLFDAPEHSMHCQEVYRELAKRFPKLTRADVWDPRYKNGDTLWTNAVRWGRHHLVQRGCLLKPHFGPGRAYWKLSETGRREVHDFIALGARLLAEIEALPRRAGDEQCSGSA